jgi:sec-independent protein translocase protein TatC
MDERDEKMMPLLDHLEELRQRIIISLISVAALAVVGWFLSPFLLRVLAEPIGTLYFFTVTGAFLVRLKVAVAVGVAASTPVILYQAWAFTLPALNRGERRYAFPAVLSATILFGVGVAFALFGILPLAVRFFLGFGAGSLKDLISVDRYLSFVLRLLIGFGVVFELPVVIFFLSKVGIVTSQGLREKRRVAVVAIALMAAMLTPPDVITMAALGIPLLILYELSIWVAKLAGGPRRRA